MNTKKRAEVMWVFQSYEEMVRTDERDRGWVADKTTEPLAKILRLRTEPANVAGTQLFLTWFQEGQGAQKEDVEALYYRIIEIVKEIAELGKSEMALIHSLSKANLQVFANPESKLVGFERAKEIIAARKEFLAVILLELASTGIIVKYITLLSVKDFPTAMVSHSELKEFLEAKMFKVVGLVDPSKIKEYLGKDQTRVGSEIFIDKFRRVVFSDYFLETILSLE